MKVLLTLTLLAIFFDGTLSLSCLSCNEVTCPPAIKCSYGIEKEVCGCCDKCLNGPLEVCGGLWNTLGNCADGLICYVDPELIQGDPIFLHPSNRPPGICIGDKEKNNIRKKRSYGGFRKPGSSLIRAKEHRHNVSGSKIPPHILNLLRNSGYKIR